MYWEAFSGRILNRLLMNPQFFSMVSTFSLKTAYSLLVISLRSGFSSRESCSSNSSAIV